MNSNRPCWFWDVNIFVWSKYANTDQVFKQMGQLFFRRVYLTCKEQCHRIANLCMVVVVVAVVFSSPYFNITFNICSAQLNVRCVFHSNPMINQVWSGIHKNFCRWSLFKGVIYSHYTYPYWWVTGAKKHPYHWSEKNPTYNWGLRDPKNLAEFIDSWILRHSSRRSPWRVYVYLCGWNDLICCRMPSGLGSPWWVQWYLKRIPSKGNKGVDRYGDEKGW